MNKFLLLIKVSRPIVWLIAPLVFIGGLYVSSASLSWQSLIQLLLLSFPYCLLLYGINDVYDYKSDRLNNRKGSVDGLKLNPKYHKFVKQASLIVIILLLLSSLITFNFFNIISMISLIFFSYFYSASPIRFKSIPIIDSLSNGIIFLFVALLGYSFVNSFDKLPPSVFYLALCVSGIHAVASVADYGSDKRAGDRTFAVVFGKRLAILFAILLMILSYFFSGIHSLLIKSYFVFCAAVFTVLFANPNEKLIRMIMYCVYFIALI